MHKRIINKSLYCAVACIAGVAPLTGLAQQQLGSTVCPTTYSIIPLDGTRTFNSANSPGTTVTPIDTRLLSPRGRAQLISVASCVSPVWIGNSSGGKGCKLALGIHTVPVKGADGKTDWEPISAPMFCYEAR